MKKKVVVITFLCFGFGLMAQNVKSSNQQKSRLEHSFFWGLFKSKSYPEDKTKAFEFETSLPEHKTAALDTLKYEEKNVLWGAIKWTEKKKKVTALKNRIDE